MFRTLGKLINTSIYKLDKPILISSLAITLMSLITIFGARENFGMSKLVMQVAMTAVGLCAVMVLVHVDYRMFVDKYWILLFIGSSFLLAITLLVGDTGANGTESANKSWLTIIKLGSRSFQIQPSEFVKIAFIVSFSKHLSLVKHRINKISTLLPLAAHAGTIVGLILLSGDLGVALVYVGIIAIMLYFAGLSLWYFVGAIGAAVIAFPFLWDYLSPYQQNRILYGFSPELDPEGFGFQPLLSLDAISAGGFFGRGINGGGFYEVLPASHTDFIFATYCEMFGFFGAIVFLIALGVLIFRMIKLARSCRTEFGGLICIGIAAMFIVQSVMNIGMCLAILPVIGITLPFMSAGGSSMLALYLSMGMLHAISAYETKSSRTPKRRLRRK